MQRGVHVPFSRSNATALIALMALAPLLPAVSRAEQGRRLQAGEDRWVPSLAISSGVWVQGVGAAGQSLYFEGMSAPVPLRPAVSGHDVGVTAFMGATLEVMTPALAIPTSPRVFLSADILPTFGSKRSPAQEGAPDCVRGPEPGDPCAFEEDGTRRRPYGEDSANGLGTRVSTELGTLAFGANLGLAFPFEIAKRQLRIKPSIAWVNYEVRAEGLLVDAMCDPEFRCTDVTPIPNGPTQTGFLREIRLSGEEEVRFNGIGPALDLEMDTGQFGQVGTSIFLGARFFRILGDRKITFGEFSSYDDQIGVAAAAARFEVEADPWLYRAVIGLRFQWVGPKRH